MMQRHIHNTRGFTLIEMLVYIAVLVLAVSAMVTLFLSLNTTLSRNQVERALAHTAQVALETMVRDIRAAETADTTVANQLTLQTKGGATTTVFSLSGTGVTLNINSTNLGSLTSDEVTVEDLTFTKYEHIGTELETTLVRVALTLSVSTKAASSTRTYYSSAVLRGSYE